jgi:hypothetical protein
MAEANAVRPQSSKSAAFSIPDMVIDRHPFAALHDSYISVCQEIALRLLRRQAKAALASRNRLEKKLRRSPFAAALGYATNLDPAQKSFLGSLARQVQANHSASHISRSQLSPLAALIRGSAKTDDKTDK